MKFYAIAFILFFGGVYFAQTNYPEINSEIEKGNFTKAETMIDEKINSGEVSEIEKLDLEFQKERMERIKQDFRKTKDDILEYVKKYYPEANENTLTKWEEDGSLEFMVIDGEKKYFNRSHTNLFLINKEAKGQKAKVAGKTEDGLYVFLQDYLPKVLNEFNETGKNILKPQEFEINYKLTVDADAVPEGEIIRAWLPFPKENHKRQGSVELLSVNSEEYVISDDSNFHRTIYFEKEVAKRKADRFLSWF